MEMRRRRERVLAMKMRRREALRRHQGLWSQCSRGSIVGERGGDRVDGVGVCDWWCEFEDARVEWPSRGRACCRIVLVRVVAMELK